MPVNLLANSQMFYHLPVSTMDRNQNINMNLTRSNFKQSIPFITKTIRDCCCYSLDFEMSGIDRNQQTKNSILDSFQQRYSKTRANIETFLPLQLGLCGFRKEATGFIASPFNFYIYPLVLNSAEDRVFSFSSGSMQFLSKYGFDFNKFFYEGIQYVSREDRGLFEGQFRLDKLRKQWKAMERIVTPDMKAFSNLHRERVVGWLKGEEKGDLKIPIKWIKGTSYRYLLETIRKEYPQITFYQSFDKEGPINRQVLTLSKNAPAGNLPPLPQEEFNNEHLLMSNIIESISVSKKPVIVHNGFLDLMHVYRRFIGRLPPTVQQYKYRLNQVFPVIYDTKFMCTTSVILYNKLKKITDLKSCYQGLKDEEQPKVNLDKDFKEYQLDGEESGEYHEAGYDALLTGIIYLKGRGMIESLSLKQGSDPAQTLKFFKNRIPQGNINNPFNIQTSSDNYKTCKSYFLQSILFSPLKESEIKAYFEENFGRISVFWTARYVFSFGVQFQQKQAQQKFQKFLKVNEGVTLMTIKKATFVAFDEEKYKEYLKGVTSFELEEEVISDQKQQNQLNGKPNDKQTPPKLPKTP